MVLKSIFYQNEYYDHFNYKLLWRTLYKIDTVEQCLRVVLVYLFDWIIEYISCFNNMMWKLNCYSCRKLFHILQSSYLSMLGISSQGGSTDRYQNGFGNIFLLVRPHLHNKNIFCAVCKMLLSALWMWLV